MWESDHTWDVELTEEALLSMDGERSATVEIQLVPDLILSNSRLFSHTEGPPLEYHGKNKGGTRGPPPAAVRAEVAGEAPVPRLRPRRRPSFIASNLQ